MPLFVITTIYSISVPGSALFPSSFETFVDSNLSIVTCGACHFSLKFAVNTKSSFTTVFPVGSLGFQLSNSYPLFAFGLGMVECIFNFYFAIQNSTYIEFTLAQQLDIMK